MVANIIHLSLHLCKPALSSLSLLSSNLVCTTAWFFRQLRETIPPRAISRTRQSLSMSSDTQCSWTKPCHNSCCSTQHLHGSCFLWINSCQPEDWQPKLGFWASQHPNRCQLQNSQQSAEVQNRHPQNLPPRLAIENLSVYSKWTTLKGKEQMRCERRQRGQESPRLMACREPPRPVQSVWCGSVCVWPAVMDERGPDTPLMSYSSHSTLALSLCTAMAWRVMDGPSPPHAVQTSKPSLERRQTQGKTQLKIKLICERHPSSGAGQSMCLLSFTILLASSVISKYFPHLQDYRQAEYDFCQEVRTAYKSNPINSPWFCGIVGLNGIWRRRDSSREHIVGW